jgi:nicotinamidase-related amidase
MLKAKFEDIVNAAAIGRTDVPVLTGELFRMAESENIVQKGDEKNLLLAIDIQNSFMENGSLGVPGSHGDVERLCRFIYSCADRISNITVSLDSHEPLQIFHPVWWKDENGKAPQPFTVINAADVSGGKWTPIANSEDSLDYVVNLERLGKKQLTIWPYHCIKGTIGQTLESMFSNLIYFFSAAKKSPIKTVIKGEDPMSEMYGIFKPEYSKTAAVNAELLKSIGTYRKIYIAGEASSHCVLESVKQMAEFYATDREMTSRIHILTDCMSPIPGFEPDTEREFLALAERYGIKLVKSTDEI